jgi:hypothetical protein
LSVNKSLNDERNHQRPRVHPLGKPEEILGLARGMAAFLVDPIIILALLDLIVLPGSYGILSKKNKNTSHFFKFNC